METPRTLRVLVFRACGRPRRKQTLVARAQTETAGFKESRATGGAGESDYGRGADVVGEVACWGGVGGGGVEGVAVGEEGEGAEDGVEGACGGRRGVGGKRRAAGEAVEGGEKGCDEEDEEGE